MMRLQFDVATLEEKAHTDPSARQWQGRLVIGIILSGFELKV